jgi:hypothetical protein
MKRMLGIDEAAIYCGLSPNSFTKHIKVDPIRIGRRRLWDRKSLDVWLDRMSRITLPQIKEVSDEDYLRLLDQ